MSAFSFPYRRHAKCGEIGHRSRAGHIWKELFSQPTSFTFDNYDDTLLLSGECNETEVQTEVVNGTSHGMVVTKQYLVPGGFPEANGNEEQIPSISTIFSADDMLRLRLESKNVTLPAALMLLDQDKYPTQSRARKSIRQRSICICRANHNSSTNNSSATLQFKELGKVISRIYPGDIIGCLVALFAKMGKLEK